MLWPGLHWLFMAFTRVYECHSNVFFFLMAAVQFANRTVSAHCMRLKLCSQSHFIHCVFLAASLVLVKYLVGVASPILFIYGRYIDLNACCCVEKVLGSCLAVCQHI